MSSQALKKMSLGYIGCKGNEAVRQSKQVYMARISGEIQDVKHKEKKDGTLNSYFVGTFVARKFDGTLYESDILYLPGFIHEKLEGTFKSGGEQPVIFGFDVFSTPNEKSSVGFGYVAKSLIQTEASDRMILLQKQLSEVPLPGAEEPAAVSKKK